MNLDIRHHAGIFMSEDMAVEYETTQDQGFSEGHPDLHLAPFRYQYGSDIASERDGLPLTSTT
jgi:hypothetical protein